MGTEGIRIGSVLGASVRLRPSWFVIAAVVTWAFEPSVSIRLPDLGRPTAYLVAAGFAALLLGSVFLHELAHAVTARRLGSPPTAIVLDLWGGHTAFSSELSSPGRSILVAAVGPATNAVLAVCGVAARALVPAGGIAELLLLALTLSNVFVAAFNALPGLPLDGGRVLEGVVWAARGVRADGTVAAGWTGRVVAAVVAGYAVGWPLLTGRSPQLYSTLWLVAIAALLWAGATQTIRVGRWRRRAPGVTARALLQPAGSLPGTATAADAVAYLRPAAAPWEADPPAADTGSGEDAGPGTPPGGVVVLDAEGRPVGFLDPDALAAVPVELLAEVPVLDVTRTLAEGAVLPDHLAGEDLVERMQRAPQDRYVVVDEAGTVAGVLAWRAVAEEVSGG
ncbi:MAG TPA: site-2 protease family protein [Kineosporiaceae bacterium]|nr:site-2 protease family protein [Kineosporiaceae bacterium]